jgi:hypothetical protein
MRSNSVCGIITRRRILPGYRVTLCAVAGFGGSTPRHSFVDAHHPVSRLLGFLMFVWSIAQTNDKTKRTLQRRTHHRDGRGKDLPDLL